MDRTFFAAALLGSLLLAGLSGCAGRPLPLSLDATAALYVRDAPGDNFTSVFVTFTRATAARGDVEALLFNGTMTVDLKRFQGGARSFLGSTPVPPGMYDGVRIWMEDAYGLRADGRRANMSVRDSPALVASDWEAREAQEVQLTLDFDLSASIRESPEGELWFEPRPSLEVARRSGPSEGEAAGHT